MFWGLAGFAVFMLAPVLGLPPELPGMPAAPLLPRQVVVAATVVATAGGLALLVFRASPLWAARGRGPAGRSPSDRRAAAASATTLVPEDLPHRFVVAVTITSFLFWIALGVSSPGSSSASERTGPQPA